MVMLFHYLPGNTILHRLNIRIKLAICVVFGFLILSGEITALCVVSIIIAAGLVMTSVPIKFLIKELRVFLVFLLLIIFISSLSTPGEILLGLKKINFGFTLEGIISGVFFAWRFLLIVLVGSCLTFTSAFSDFRYAVMWLLTPFPFVNKKLISTMISLVLRFIPAFLDSAEDISMAYKSRCMHKRKNIFIKPLYFLKHLLSKSFLRADEITLAMQARCFSQDNND
jgi:energy-coupling factor transporter transmembrane protein EcfT